MEPLPLAPLPAVLCTQEVASLLRLSTRSVLEMVRAGTLPAHRTAGRRRYHFLAEEVLAAVSGRALDQRDRAALPAARPEAPAAAVDPCDVWGSAPSRNAQDWAERCVERWVQLATAAGLVATVACGPEIPDPRGVGAVDVDGLTYAVLAGPRQRVRCLGDDGEPAWELIDSVWVDPRR